MNTEYGNQEEDWRRSWLSRRTPFSVQVVLWHYCNRAGSVWDFCGTWLHTARWLRSSETGDGTRGLAQLYAPLRALVYIFLSCSEQSSKLWEVRTHIYSHWNPRWMIYSRCFSSWNVQAREIALKNLWWYGIEVYTVTGLLKQGT